MEYVITSIVGLFAVLCVKKFWKQSTQIAFILTMIVMSSAIYILIDISLYNDWVSKGNTVTNISLFEFSLYLTMLLGMAAKYLYDAIGENNTLKFQKWQLFKPMLISPIVFGAIYGNTGDEASKYLLLVFAFQNGFFWKTVLDRRQS
jgi:hypothetical protein